MKIRFLFMSILLSTSLFAQYSTNTWIGGNGNWNVSSNWEYGIPEDWNIVLIEGDNDNVTIPSGYNAVCRNLYIKHQNAKIDVNGNLTIDANDIYDGIENYGELNINDSGSIDISNTGGAGTLGQGILNFGFIYNHGDVTIYDIAE